ncbi:MAG: hypothetical protein HC927_02755 [Deltaproteobacteria bacterium]|nr:hypothetical protein [Deltaproteobacteria bacterium]
MTIARSITPAASTDAHHRFASGEDRCAIDVVVSIHQGLVTLLSEDHELLLDLVRAVAELRWPEHVRIEETTPNLELLKLFSNKPAGAEAKREQSVYRLFPDLIFKIYDADGELVGVLVVEVQVRGDDDKTYKLSAYRASVQVHHGIMAELLGVSSDPAGRNWLRSLRAKVKDPPDVVGLAAVTQVCNPQAEWLLDPNNPGPPRTRATGLEPRSSMQSITGGTSGPVKSCWPPCWWRASLESTLGSATVP